MGSDTDMHKFTSMLHYIIYKCSDKPNVGKTVLYKLCYFSDFDNFEKYEKSITGMTYYHLEHGPAPTEHAFDIAISSLASQGKVGLVPKGKTRHYHSVVIPDMSEFSKEEMQTIDDVISRLSDKNAEAISEWSHEDIPWKITEMGEPLDYNAVFYRSPKLSVRPDDDDDE